MRKAHRLMFPWDGFLRLRAQVATHVAFTSATNGTGRNGSFIIIIIISIIIIVIVIMTRSTRRPESLADGH